MTNNVIGGKEKDILRVVCKKTAGSNRNVIKIQITNKSRGRQGH